MTPLDWLARILLAMVGLLLLGAVARKLWCDRHPSLGSLMDTGDGQGGIPGGQPPLGQLARPLDPDPALGCGFCGPPFDPRADCGCASPCKDPNCGALAWAAISNTEEWER